MSDCPAPLNCGCAESNCPPLPLPDLGEEAPGSGSGCCESDGPQPPQSPTDPECCECDCDCGGTGGASGPGPTGPPSIGQPPTIPGMRGYSPAINAATGNLYYNIPLVHSGPYAPPVKFTYNAKAASQKIQYGYGVAGLYNQTIQQVEDDADAADVIKGDGSSWRYTDRDDRPVEFDYYAYRKRNTIERLIGWLKESRRIMTRFEKTAVNFLAMVKWAFVQRYLRLMIAE